MNSIRGLQNSVVTWFRHCFQREPSSDGLVRIYRFTEEALEFAQSMNVTKEEVLQLVDYVYSRPIGEPKQEVGGVMLTLAAACAAFDFDLQDCTRTELQRVWDKAETIRAKDASKPAFSPLPGTTTGAVE